MAYCETPKKSVDPQKLINDLGSPTYSVREAAEEGLVFLDNKEILLANAKHEDLEIRFRVQRALESYQEVKPIIGSIPMVWFLPAEHRYEENIWNDETQSFSTDLAVFFYEKAYHFYFDKVQPNSYATQLLKERGRIFYDIRNNEFGANFNREVAEYATKLWIGHVRLTTDITRKEVQRILAEAQDHQQDFGNKRIFFIDYERIDNEYYGRQWPMSVMVTQEVTEGIPIVSKAP